MNRMPVRWDEPQAPHTVISLPADHVSVTLMRTKRRLLARATRPVYLKWRQLPALIKQELVALPVLAGTAGLAVAYINPFFMFGLTLVLRTLFYLAYYLRVEVRRFGVATAARTLCGISVFAYVAVTAEFFQTDARWRLWAYAFLMIALTMEIVGVRTWYTRWVVHDCNLNDRDGGMAGAIEPKVGSVLGAYLWLGLEYVAFGILWIPLLDDVILTMYHVILFLTHVVWFIFHIVVVLLNAL